ncbi:MAG: DNA-protecting protein DprA [Candidatus Melainabacteria bacterium]|nr:DNA-protecting protein DprA [Candidatus Melainabacteria bacterium]
MKSIKDLFLLLSHVIEFQSEKVLLKKLFQNNNLEETFESEFKLNLSNLELEKINRLRTEIKKIILSEIKKTLTEKEINFIGLSDPEYPKKLLEINDPPVGLFYRGKIDLLNHLKSVAIVGTRSATNYGINISTKIASLLAEKNIVIISGLAAGIDTSAHIGALKSGKTIAVLGTGVDVVFPTSNKNLFNEILNKNSLIISEYPPSTPGVGWNFPQRNRIISALSDAVVIIEGDLQSGAMITAKFAIKQGKSLFALPGLVDSPTSNGPNVLIKSRVAELLISVNDILEKFGEGKQTKLSFDNENEKIENLSECEKNIYKLLSSTSKNFETLIQETNLEVKELLKYLSMLELKGLVEKAQDGGYARLLV